MRVLCVALLLLALLSAHPLLARHPRARAVAADLLAAVAVALSPGFGWGIGWRVALPVLLLAAAAWRLRDAGTATGFARPVGAGPAHVATMVLALILASSLLVLLRGSTLGVALGIAGSGLVAAVSAPRTADPFGAFRLVWLGMLLAAWLVPAAGPSALLLVLAVRIALDALDWRGTAVARRAGPPA